MRQSTALPGGFLYDAAERLLGTPSTLLDGMRKAAHRRQVFLRTFRELEACSDRDLDDIGIARADIRRLAREASESA